MNELNVSLQHPILTLAALAAGPAGTLRADGSRAGYRSAGGFWPGRLGDGGGQAQATAFVSDRFEPFTQRLQRGGVAADDRELHPRLGKCVPIFWRSAQ